MTSFAVDICNDCCSVHVRLLNIFWSLYDHFFSQTSFHSICAVFGSNGAGMSSDVNWCSVECLKSKILLKPQKNMQLSFLFSVFAWLSKSHWSDSRVTKSVSMAQTREMLQIEPISMLLKPLQISFSETQYVALPLHTLLLKYTDLVRFSSNKTQWNIIYGPRISQITTFRVQNKRFWRSEILLTKTKWENAFLGLLIFDRSDCWKKEEMVFLKLRWKAITSHLEVLTPIIDSFLWKSIHAAVTRKNKYYPNIASDMIVCSVLFEIFSFQFVSRCVCTLCLWYFRCRCLVQHCCVAVWTGLSRLLRISLRLTFLIKWKFTVWGNLTKGSTSAEQFRILVRHIASENLASVMSDRLKYTVVAWIGSANYY